MRKGDVEAMRAHVNEALDHFPPGAEMDFVFIFSHEPSNTMQMVNSYPDVTKLALVLDHVIKRVRAGDHGRERFQP